MQRASYLRRLCVLKDHCVKSVLPEQTSSYSSQPALKLSTTKALVDEEVGIFVTGLSSGEKVTLQTFLKDGEKYFGSCGYYMANTEGIVNTLKDECLGGTFDGFEPMGLFWSIRSPPDTKVRRILQADVTKSFTVKIGLHLGFKDLRELPWTEDLPCVASCDFEQCFMIPGVQRITVTEDGLKGDLYLPPGEGPFPAIIDLFGMTALFPGHRSSLLASNGIASFALAYVGPGLASSYEDLDFSYFLRAYDWLAKHPSVNPQAMGGLGSCIGGAYTSLIAWKRPSMKCFVGLNSVTLPAGQSQDVEGEWFESSGFPLERRKIIDGAVSFRPLASPEDNLQPLPYWKHGIKVLHIQGSDDQCLDPEVLRSSHANFVPEGFKENFEFICYPGAGHIIEPPFLPLCRTNYNPIFKMFFLWGGQPKQHAHAQIDSWPRIVAFFKKHLMQK